MHVILSSDEVGVFELRIKEEMGNNGGVESEVAGGVVKLQLQDLLESQFVSLRRLVLRYH